MLPGLRFLFAASLICASLLVFGMGAIALLRASHQQFASAPPGLPPEPVFAQAPQTIPSLSLLRIEPEAEVAPAEGGSLEAVPANQPDAPLPASQSQPDAQAPANASPDMRTETTPSPGQAATPPRDGPATDAADAREPAPEPVAPDTVASPPAQNAARAEEPAPAQTGSIAMPEDQPTMAAPLADPPLPQARPGVAALGPAVEPVRPKATSKASVKPSVKRKVRQTRKPQPKTERLPAVTSAPTLGSLFGSN